MSNSTGTINNRNVISLMQSEMHSLPLIKALLISIGLTLVLFSGMVLADKGEGQRVCSSIAKAAFKACNSEVMDDYWINYGNCLNTDERDEKRECIKEARSEKHEAKSLCREQKSARNEICDLIGQAPYTPEIDPANFLDLDGIIANPNPYYPLTPGLTKIFTSGEETITVVVTDQTKEIMGVTCVVVRDTVKIGDELIEDTDDWYAQDINGNVWYFGELSRNYEDGELVDLDGSWKAGVDEAQPGILMYAAPEVGQVYRQEFLLGEAEDMGEVISVSETAASTDVADCSAGCVVTRDFLPIEPDVNEFKYYAPGIGFILATEEGSDETEELVEIIFP